MDRPNARTLPTPKNVKTVKSGHISMSQHRFEPTDSVFERRKTVRASDLRATTIGILMYLFNESADGAGYTTPNDKLTVNTEVEWMRK
jgi:hypothetical protein